MDGDFFFVIGIVLVLAAVAISFVGIRGSEKFPPSRLILVGVTALFAVIVGTTMAFAVVKSVDEQDKRNEELAKEDAEAEPENADQNEPPASTPGGAPEASEGGNQQEPQTSGAATPSETIEVSSPEDGGLIFEPDGLESQPGNLTIDYDNPSPVPHSIAVATANGNVLGETTPAANGKQTLDVTNLAPGKYVFYCTVPGHREGGMEGNLTVTGGPTP
jgi:plastocyanin